MSTKEKLPDLWVRPLDSWVDHLATVCSPATVSIKRIAVSRLARGVAGDPWSVTEGTIASLVASQGWSRDYERAWVGNVRDFFEFAVAQQWTNVVPVRPRQPRKRSAELPTAWVAPIEAWVAQLERDGFTEQTVGDRRRAARRAAKAFGGDPWAVTPQRVDAYVASQAWADYTRDTWVRTLRLFYEFAVSRGWTSAVPTKSRYDALVNKPAAEVWAAELTTWSTWLRASAQSPRTIAQRTYHLRRLSIAFPDWGPWEISLEDLAAWLGDMQVTSSTQRSVLQSLRAFYRWGMTTGRISMNPAAELPNIKPKRAVPRPAPEDAVEAALGGDDRVRDMVELAATLGLRRSEIARVHTSWLQRRSDGWWLRVIGKGDEVRELPMTDELGSRLAALPPGYVFPGNDDGHLSAAHVGKLISGRLPGRWTAHTLRHRFASRAYEPERDILAVRDLLGHALVSTTQIYVSVPDGARRRATLHAATVG